MPYPLIIRNLSATSFSIRRIECFEDPKSAQSKPNEYSLGTAKATSAAPSASELSEHVHSFRCEDSNIEFASFESCTLRIVEAEREQPVGHSNGMTMRITLEDAAGFRYRIDTNPSHTQKSSKILTPLSTNPSVNYKALFHPSTPTGHLTIYQSNLFDYEHWMKPLPDTLALSAISIPGTHNSHTHYRALPSVRCQTTDIKTQLENGIRFLDIRLQPTHATDPIKKDLYLVHGSFPISLTGPKLFSPVLETIYTFLATHPSEIILLSLKREGIGNATDIHFAHILQKHYIAPDPSKWYTRPEIPSLGTARGKIVLVRRFKIPTELAPLGLDASSWPHSTPHALFPEDNAVFCIQDFHDVLDPKLIPDKVRYVNEHIGRAAACVHSHTPISLSLHDTLEEGQGLHEEAGKRGVGSGGGCERIHPIHLNFLSASNFWKRACWPEKIAGTINRGMEEWLCVGHHLREGLVEPGEPERVDVSTGNGGDDPKGHVIRKAGTGDGGTGVVIMDFVGEGGDWELVRLVVGMNMGVLMKGVEK